MPTYGDFLPDIAGRKLGNAQRPWEVWATDIHYSGVLSGPPGANVGLFENTAPDTDTLLVRSDTGSGGMLDRFVIENAAGGINVTGRFLNMIALFLGDPDGAVSDNVQLNLMQPLANADDLFNAYDKGATFPAGRKLFSMSATGEIRQRMALAASLAHNIYLLDDAQPTFQILGSGEIRFGPGGGAALDSGLKRQASGTTRVTLGNANAGDLEVRQLISLAVAPTPPFVLSSNIRVPNLNADFLDSFDWDSPGALGAIAPNSGIFTALQASGVFTSTIGTGTAPMTVTSQTPVNNLTVRRADNLIISTGVFRDGSGFKSRRQSTGSIAAGAYVDITVTWTTPFANSSYTCSVFMFDSVGAGAGLEAHLISAQAADHITVRVHNTDTIARTGTLHVIAYHDDV